MDIDEYLREIAEHIDDDSFLSQNLGIRYDTYILLGRGYNEVAEGLLRDGMWRFDESLHENSGLEGLGNFKVLQFARGGVEARILDWIPFIPGPSTEFKRLIEGRGYETALGYDETDGPDMEGASGIKACALAVGDIGNYIRREGIPYLFPTSWGHTHKGDYSRIVSNQTVSL